MSTALTESHVRGRTDQPLIEQTLGAFFNDMVERFPEREALVVVHQGRRYTYRQLQTESRRLASALLGLGLKPGDRIGIWSHNNAEWVLMQLATAQVGIILVNINPAYRTAEVEYALNKVGCKALVAASSFKSSDYAAMLRELRRVGGLLKHHFATVQQAGLGEGISAQMSDTLRLLSRSIEIISRTFRTAPHDR